VNAGEQPIVDVAETRPIVERAEMARGAKWHMVRDVVELRSGHTVQREVVVHPGAVGIVALDEELRVFVIRQYRHPVAAQLWEIPAGLLDEPGEDPLEAAKRELLEEVGLRASEWDHVIDVFSSPGMSSEVVRVFLARGLSPVIDHERPELVDEEVDLRVTAIPLSDLVDHVLAGRVHNALAVAGILAVAEAQRRGWSSLQPPGRPWPTPSWAPPG
jgi:ADP-ribose pyrophosphatase